MIERDIVKDKFLEFRVSEYVSRTLKDVPIKCLKLEKNPMGERVTIYTSTPGLIIGREGSNIKRLTETLKKEFKFENPQIKIGDVDNMYLSASIVAKRIANDLATYGQQKFKLTAFKVIQSIMNSGAMGVEIKISGKIPSARAKTWLFTKGYLKKTGYVSDFLVDHAIDTVTLKTGVVGIKVSIMLPGTPLPDKIEYLDSVISSKLQENINNTKDSKNKNRDNLKEFDEDEDVLNEEVEE